MASGPVGQAMSSNAQHRQPQCCHGTGAHDVGRVSWSPAPLCSVFFLWWDLQHSQRLSQFHRCRSVSPFPAMSTRVRSCCWPPSPWTEAPGLQRYWRTLLHQATPSQLCLHPHYYSSLKVNGLISYLH